MCIKLTSKKYFFLLFFLLEVTAIFSQRSYSFEWLNSESGLPSNLIKGLQFDNQHRFLWIVSESGLSRYNGHQIKTFEDHEEILIEYNRISYLLKTDDNKLIGKITNGTSFLINENNIKIRKKSSTSNNLNEFIEEKFNIRKSISNTNENKVIQLNNSKTTFFSNNYKTFKINNKIFSINDGILLLYNDNKLEPLMEVNKKAQGFQIGDHLFLVDNNNLFEIVISVNKINKSFITKLHKIKQSEIYFKKDEILNIFQNTPKEDVFIINQNKLYRLNYKQNKFSFEVLIDNLLINDYYNFVQIDSITQNIYLGSANKGVLICRPKYFNRIKPNNFSPNKIQSVYAQVLLKNGNIQLNDGPIFGKSSKTSPVYFKKRAEPATFISSKNILYFTDLDGIHEYDITHSKLLKITNKNIHYRNVFIEFNNLMYLISNKGVAKKNNKNEWVYLLNFLHTPINFIVFDIKKLNNDELLVATSDGLYKYNFKKNSFKLFFRDKSKANFRSIFKIDNYFLIGTYGGGIYIYKNDTIKKFPMDPNAYLKYAHCFIEDKEQNVWINTNKGLFTGPKKSVLDYWFHGVDSVKYSYFGKLNGIDILEMNGGCTPCALFLPNDNISFPGIDGLIQFNPYDINIKSLKNIEPHVYIDKIALDNTTTNSLAQSNNFSSKTKTIDIFLAVSGMLPEQNIILEYRFGQNGLWNNILLNNPIIHLDEVSYGQYKIYLRWRNTANTKYGQIIIPFYINYPIALHPIAVFYYTVIIFSTFVFYSRYKTISYQKRQVELETEINLKTKSLVKINKYLTARNKAKDQVLAIVNHDVLIPLKYLHITANSLINKTKDIGLQNTIQEIANTSKELEYLTKNMLNWVKYDSTNLLYDIQEVDLYELVEKLIYYLIPFFENKQIELNNNIPIGTKILNWPDPLRVLLYNILINAIKSSDKVCISITLEQRKTQYVINIKDNGCGMSEAMANFLISGKPKDNIEILPKYKFGNGIGFQIIRNIIKLMNAKLLIKSKENFGTLVSMVFNNY